MWRPNEPTTTVESICKVANMCGVNKGLPQITVSDVHSSTTSAARRQVVSSTAHVGYPLRNAYQMEPISIPLIGKFSGKMSQKLMNCSQIGLNSLNL